MISHTAELIEILTTEKSLYEDLLVLLAEERQALLSMSPDDILSISKAKETLVLRLKAMEESRLETTKRIADIEGLPSDKLNLKTIINLLQGSHRKIFEDLRKNLFSLVTRCREESERNKIALSSGSRVFADAMNFFRKALSAPPVYGESSKIKMRADSGKVLSRQA